MRHLCLLLVIHTCGCAVNETPNPDYASKPGLYCHNGLYYHPYSPMIFIQAEDGDGNPIPCTKKPTAKNTDTQ